MVDLVGPPLVCRLWGLVCVVNVLPSLCWAVCLIVYVVCKCRSCLGSVVLLGAVLAQAHFLAQAPFRLKHSHNASDPPCGGSLVVLGCAAATQVSEPPRGCRWETDVHGHIGLRMLTRLAHDQSFGVFGGFGD